MIITAIGLGLLIGLSLGLLGGGGSILTVPIFVYILGFPPRDAVAMSLAVVGATSAIGVVTHWRAGRVNPRIGLLFGGVAMLGTYGGTYLARFLSGSTQLALFGLVMAVAALFMSRPRKSDEPAAALVLDAATVIPLVIEAIVVGVLTGVIGVGGGFLIVPALVLAALPMSQAVGTSLFVITMNCATGLYGYLGHAAFAWSAVGLVTAGTVPGIALGTHFHGLIPQATLRRGFAVFLVVIAAFILYQNAAALASLVSLLTLTR